MSTLIPLSLLTYEAIDGLAATMPIYVEDHEPEKPLAKLSSMQGDAAVLYDIFQQYREGKNQRGQVQLSHTYVHTANGNHHAWVGWATKGVLFSTHRVDHSHYTPPRAYQLWPVYTTVFQGHGMGWYATAGDFVTGIAAIDILRRRCMLLSRFEYASLLPACPSTL